MRTLPVQGNEFPLTSIPNYCLFYELYIKLGVLQVSVKFIFENDVI